MRLYIIRHADPDYKNGTITEHGHKEAKALAERLKIEGIDQIYCSPVQRAIDTMNYTKELLNIELITLNWTREISDWMGDKKHLYTSTWDVPAEIIHSQKEIPTHYNWYNIDEYKGLNLEKKFNEIKVKSDEFIESLGYKKTGNLYECVNHNEKKIAIFCHAGFEKTWFAHLLQIPLTLVWSGFWVAPSSVTTIVFEKRSENYAMPKCLAFGDTSHLYKAGLPIRPRGLLGNFY